MFLISLTVELTAIVIWFRSVLLSLNFIQKNQN